MQRFDLSNPNFKIFIYVLEFRFNENLLNSGKKINFYNNGEEI